MFLRRLTLAAGFSLLLASCQVPPPGAFAVFVFTRTAGYRHDSIPAGIAAIRALGEQHGFSVDASEDSRRFTDSDLRPYRAVVFLNTAGTVLDPPQRAAFERFIRRGGGFVGIHSAADTEHDWPWYVRLIGAYFESHPEIQAANLRIEDRRHPSTLSLPETWRRTDEWYNFAANLRGHVRVLAVLDESSYSGGAMGVDHPIAWCQDFDGGHSWYTALGHTAAAYDEPLFRMHLLGGIQSVAGGGDGGCRIGP